MTYKLHVFGKIEFSRIFSKNYDLPGQVTHLTCWVYKAITLSTHHIAYICTWTAVPINFEKKILFFPTRTSNWTWAVGHFFDDFCDFAKITYLRTPINFVTSLYKRLDDAAKREKSLVQPGILHVLWHHQTQSYATIQL